MLERTKEIVSAYVGKNSISLSDLPDLIVRVHNTIANLSQGGPAKAPRPEPAVPIKKSVRIQYIICLEDGKKLKMLKRYLRARYNLTPEEYRARWGLPSDYPMVAPEYAKRRSDYAKKFGLGKNRS